MLRVNQLSGFGGIGFGMLVSTGSSAGTNTPSFTVDLGPAGLKQVICAFASIDTDGSTPWTYGTGAVGAEAFTYVVPGGEETAGNGGAFTGGATVRALQTTLGGSQTISMSISGFVLPMDMTRMLCIVIRGVSTTPISYDGGSNQPAPDGDNFTISTVGARLVIGATAAATAPGNFQGPGNAVTVYTDSNIAFGYDLAPAGTTGNVYSFTGGKYSISGASFG